VHVERHEAIETGRLQQLRQQLPSLSNRRAQSDRWPQEAAAL